MIYIEETKKHIINPAEIAYVNDDIKIVLKSGVIIELPKNDKEFEKFVNTCLTKQ